MKISAFCRRRRNQSSDEEDCRKPLRGKNGSVMSEKPKDLVELHRMTYPTSGMMSHPPIRVENFGQHLNLLKADDFEQFIQEFEVSHPFSIYTLTKPFAMLICNMEWQIVRRLPFGYLSFKGSILAYDVGFGQGRLSPSYQRAKAGASCA